MIDNLVRERGVEPLSAQAGWILSPVRLPIPPLSHGRSRIFICTASPIVNNQYRRNIRKILKNRLLGGLFSLVGASGFEPPALWTPFRYATRLRHAPTHCAVKCWGHYHHRKIMSRTNKNQIEICSINKVNQPSRGMLRIMVTCRATAGLKIPSKIVDRNERLLIWISKVISASGSVFLLEL